MHSIFVVVVAAAAAAAAAVVNTLHCKITVFRDVRSSNITLI